MRNQMQLSKKHIQAKVLHRGLAQLQALLAALSRHQRLQTAELLSMQLRSALIQHGEVARWKELCQKRSAIPEGKSLCNASRGYRTWSKQSKRHRRGTGAVSAIRVGRDSMGYIARLTVNGITVSSRCTKSFQDADYLRQLLADLHQVLEAMPGAFDQIFRAAFTPGGRGGDLAPPLPQGILRLQESAWRFRVRVDARACTGRLLTSRSLTSVDEALSLCKEAHVAKQHGWSALRSLWARCMSLRRHSASKHACCRLANLDASREKYASKSATSSQQDRIHNKIWRLVPRLERRLAATSEKTKAAQSFQSQSHASLASLASQSTDGPEARSRCSDMSSEMLRTHENHENHEIPNPVKLGSEQIPV